MNYRTLTKVPITPSLADWSRALSHQEGIPRGLKIKTKIGVALFDLSWTIGVGFEEDYDNEEDSDGEDVEHKDGSEYQN